MNRSQSHAADGGRGQGRRPKHKGRHTDQALARALGVARETIVRRRKDGMPMPQRGEALDAWARRASAWHQAHTRRPGRPTSDAAERALCESRRARALRAEIRVERRRATVHTQQDCQAHLRAVAGDVGSAFSGLALEVASQVAASSDPTEITQMIDAAVVHRLRELAGPDQETEEPDQRPQEAAIAAELLANQPDAGAPLEEVSDYWLARLRRARTRSDELDLEVDRGDVHERRECDSRLLGRLAECRTVLLGIGAKLARRVHLASADVVRNEIEQEVERALAVLRGDLIAEEHTQEQ